MDGCLLPTSLTPSSENRDKWTDKGDWLALAKKLNAQSVFFVENEPLVVLAELPDGEDETLFFNRIWCMARPQLLFLAREGELAVYQLSKPPVRGDESLAGCDRLLGLARSVADIQSNLALFRREALESGSFLGDQRFEGGAFRADRALIHDLKEVRRLLTEGDHALSAEVAHALIGRALFVRYLEDRKILIDDYFQSIAAKSKIWKALLNTTPTQTFADPEFSRVLFFRVLLDLDFTYALFEQLARDFNGDTFPVTSKERSEVRRHHLDLLRRLLTGEGGDSQQQLFLFAYKFDVIPIELISSIYEEFYTAHKGKGKTQSSYYTPPALVDFLLSRVLTEDALEKRPRIIDPSCGSGIFLVEAFRRIVRDRIRRQGRRLAPRELRTILREQIAGIDLNPEALPVAAFSLYLAYLHYQQPPEINENRRLPNLKWNPTRHEEDPNQYLDILFAGNAFEAIEHRDCKARMRFGPGSADLVVGNPPWGEVKPDDALGVAALKTTLAWCDADSKRIIGDKEQSQAFVHLALELLRDGGRAALLLSSGVLFKSQEKSKHFRRSWLSQCKLIHIVNFAHVRHLYFSDPVRRGKGGLRESDGSSPFISAIFEKGIAPLSHRFTYWAARRTSEVEKSRAIIVNHSDMHRIRQEDAFRRDDLWKIYWWGGRRDEGLVRELERFPGLGNIDEQHPSKGVISGVGYVKGKAGRKPSEWLLAFKELSVKSLARYGDINPSSFCDPPRQVRRKGIPEIYEGFRLLLKRGRGGNQGRIDVRLASDPFCFTHSIIGYRLSGFSEWEAECVIGAFWSSLARYYFWLTAGSWGLWHDETLVGSVSRFPIALPDSAESGQRVISVVRALRSIEPHNKKEIVRLEAELDDAIFDLYELNDADRDLVRDMNHYGLDFFYRRSASIAVMPVKLPQLPSGLLSDLPTHSENGLVGYLQVFLAQWNADLTPTGELAWHVVTGPHEAPVLAVIFSTVTTLNGSVHPREISTLPMNEWEDVLKRFSDASLLPLDAYRTIFTDTFVRAVAEHEILIIKRNEARFWTRSMARADADATIAQAIHLAEKRK